MDFTCIPTYRAGNGRFNRPIAKGGKVFSGPTTFGDSAVAQKYEVSLHSNVPFSEEKFKKFLRKKTQPRQTSPH